MCFMEEVGYFFVYRGGGGGGGGGGRRSLFPGGGAVNGIGLFIRCRFLLKLKTLQLPLEFFPGLTRRFTNPVHKFFEQDVNVVGKG